VFSSVKVPVGSHGIWPDGVPLFGRRYRGPASGALFPRRLIVYSSPCSVWRRRDSRDDLVDRSVNRTGVGQRLFIIVQVRGSRSLYEFSHTRGNEWQWGNCPWYFGRKQTWFWSLPSKSEVTLRRLRKSGEIGGMVVLESYFGGHMCGCAPQVKCKHLGKSAVFAAPEGFRNARRKMFKASTSPPQSNRENRTDQNMNRATKQNKTK